MKTDQKQLDLQAKIDELTNDLQRTRADFENYRKHTEQEIASASSQAEKRVINRLLPTIDIIDQAIAQLPAELKNNTWANGVVAMHAKLLKSLKELQIEVIDTKAGDSFDHNIHNAIQMDEAEGEREVIKEVLRTGYKYHGKIIRPAMVSVTRK